jgi:hypothetical protein
LTTPNFLNPDSKDAALRKTLALTEEYQAWEKRSRSSGCRARFSICRICLLFWKSSTSPATLAPRITGASGFTKLTDPRREGHVAGIVWSQVNRELSKKSWPARNKRHARGSYSLGHAEGGVGCRSRRIPRFQAGLRRSLLRQSVGLRRWRRDREELPFVGVGHQRGLQLRYNPIACLVNVGEHRDRSLSKE